MSKHFQKNRRRKDINTLDSEDKDLGLRLKAVREKAGLSQRALAKKANVTNSTISLIEAGKVNTSVSALRRILDGIPISMSDFFAFEPSSDTQVFYAAEELIEIGKGKLSLKRIGANQLGRAMTMMRETYDVGADTGRVMYQHEGEEAGIVIEGNIEITVGEQRKILRPGDAYYFNSTTPHRFRQVGPHRCILVSACTPPTF